MVRPERFELPASWFVARRSIQLSYGRARGANITTPINERHSNAISPARRGLPRSDSLSGSGRMAEGIRTREDPTQIGKLLISHEFHPPAIPSTPLGIGT